MSATALALVLSGALVHALWNLELARVDDRLPATALALATGALALLPVALATGHVHKSALPYAAASATFHLAYFALLAPAYGRADLSVAYPVARGSAPVLVLLVSTAFLGARPSLAGVAGVLAVAAGVLLVRPANARAAPVALALAMAVGACTAGYTLFDKQGLEHASPLPYLALLIAPTAAVYLAATVRARGTAALRASARPTTFAAGLGMVGAYGLTLAALKLAPAAAVAALRETSVVIAAGLAAAVLGEPVGRRRAGGAVVVFAGIALITLA